MNYVLIIDSVACLPYAEIQRRKLEVIPLSIIVEGKKYIDTHDEQILGGLHKSGLINVDTEAKTISSTEADIRHYLFKEILPKYDVALCQTLGMAYSPIYESYRSVTFKVAQDAQRVRQEHNINRPFQMSCMSSASLAAGQGLLAIYSDELLKKSSAYNQAKESIENFKQYIKSFTIVRDPIYTRQHAKSKGNDTVSYPMAWVADKLNLAPIGNNQNEEIHVVDVKSRGFENSVSRVLAYCCEHAQAGLKMPWINISYAGDPATLPEFDNFLRLQSICNENGITLLTGVMTMGAGINLGPGSMSVGIAPEAQDTAP